MIWLIDHIPKHFIRMLLAAVVTYFVITLAIAGYFIKKAEGGNIREKFSKGIKPMRRLTRHPTIVVITATYRKITRPADMTRLAQTLMHIRSIIWLVVEDGEEKSPLVQRILKRSGIPFRYFAHKRGTSSEPGKFPDTRCFARNAALNYLRSQADIFPRDTIVYFADEDNAYDIRLFSDYISKVQTVGVWAVGFVANQLLEAPLVNNGKVVGWQTADAPNRPWGLSLPGFAVRLELLIRFPLANFDCRNASPGSYLLERLNITQKDVQPFGFDKYPKEVLVWQTKTQNEKPQIHKTYGYLVEL